MRGISATNPTAATIATTATALIWLFALSAIGSAADVSKDVVSLGGLSVTVWSTPSSAAQPKPVVLFSHGFHGCAIQSVFLTEAMARAGYIVFAPNHRDAACGGAGRRDAMVTPDVKFRDAAAWTSNTYRARGDDIRRLAAAIATNARFRSQADSRRIALVGHSLGGYTMLGLAGAWQDWQPIPGVKAVIALSPYSDPFVVKHTLGKIAVPVMYQGGTRDIGVTPIVRKPGGAYDQTPAPKYFVEFAQASHLAWTGVTTTAHDSIVEYSVAFLDHYVKGEPADPVLTAQRGDVTTLRYASELGTRPAGTR